MELQAGVSLFLAGRIAPLALLPPAVAGVAGVLWFRSMLAFPVDLLTGAVQGTDAILRGLGGQVVWLAVWILAYRVPWSRGIRRDGAGARWNKFSTFSPPSPPVTPPTASTPP